MRFTLKELAELVEGELRGNPDIEVNAAAPIDSARPGQITFLANSKYEPFLNTTAASAVIMRPDISYDRTASIRHPNPYYAFAVILDLLYPDDDYYRSGISNLAHLAPTAILGNDCSVGAFTVVGDHSTIGSDTVIMPDVFIGRNVTIGAHCKIYPNVSILDDTRIGDHVIIHSGTVIGSDGFGFARHPGGIKKVKQVGWVEIGYDVEIGANCGIDRGALGATRIGNGVKIDNLVQIAHNVQIGDYSIIVAQVGISGSTKLGKGVILAGQVGLVGHIEVGDGATVGAQSGVSKDIPAGKIFFGYPAREAMLAKRIEACLSRLPELFKRVRDLEEKSRV